MINSSSSKTPREMVSVGPSIATVMALGIVVSVLIFAETAKENYN